MIDVGTPIRAAYFAKLSGHLFWEGAVVPVVDEKLDTGISTQNVYVLFTSQVEDTSMSNRSYYVSEVTMRIQIVNQRQATATREVVENISGQILSILFPTRTTWDLSLPAPMKLTYARLSGSDYNPLIQSDNGLIISKYLEFKNRITH